MVRNNPDDSKEGGLCFEPSDEELFKYKPELPKLGRDISFNHREELDGTPPKLAKFSLDIGVVTSNEDVAWLKVTSDEGRVYYDKVTKTITVPAGQRPEWRTTHVLVAGLVKSLANDDLIGLTGFSCVPKGRVYLRDLGVGLSSPAGSVAMVSAGTDAEKPAAATVPLTRTPRYLLPEMEGVPVPEPAIYSSLYIMDTIDETPPLPPPRILAEAAYGGAQRWTVGGGGEVREDEDPQQRKKVIGFHTKSPVAFFTYNGTLNETVHTNLNFLHRHGPETDFTSRSP